MPEKAGKGIRTLDIQLGKRVSQAPLERKPHCGSLNAGASYRLCRMFLRTSVRFRTGCVRERTAVGDRVLSL